jgi:hypothetical protein
MIVASVLIVAICKSVQMSIKDDDLYLTAMDLDDTTKKVLNKDSEE